MNVYINNRCEDDFVDLIHYLYPLLAMTAHLSYFLKLELFHYLLVEKVSLVGGQCVSVSELC